MEDHTKNNDKLRRFEEFMKTKKSSEDFVPKIEKRHPALYVLSGPNQGVSEIQRLFLRKGIMRIGRCGCGGLDIELEDEEVSGRHATLEIDNVVRIRDNNSTNGVYVNGKRVNETELKDGDIIRLGQHLLSFRFVDEKLPKYIKHSSGLFGVSPPFMEVVEQCRKVAPKGVTVLLQGETGTGKDCLAYYIHCESSRSGKYIPINCAAIPSTLIEGQLFGYCKGAFAGAESDFPGYARSAKKGTLFLDEIGEIPLEVQPKFLRFLENKEVAPLGMATPIRVDVRLVVGTNRDLEEMVRTNRFRQDLYSRLLTCRVKIPPLRERPEDVILISTEVMKKKGLRISPSALETLCLWDWPYNVRELLSVIEQLSIDPPPDSVVRSPKVKELLRKDNETSAPAVHRFGAPSPEELQRIMEETGGNITETAKRLGCSRQQVYRWMKRHGMALPGRGDRDFD